MLHLVLTALDASLANAWRRHCGEFDFVTVEQRSILDVDADALVSPANSFGFMDGGIDLVYSEYFGWQLQARVQQMIRARHAGELPVGNADVVATGHPRFAYLIVAPTMRVPQALLNSANPYLAARAVLRLIGHGQLDDGTALSQRIRRIAFPGLGTGIGAVSADVCARQMRAAIEQMLLGTIDFPRSWPQAQERHYALVRPDRQRGEP